MIEKEAQRILQLARRAELLGPDAKTWVERLTPLREDLLETARFLVKNGQEDQATELAAQVWRLWLLKGDISGGRAFLAAALDSGEGRPSRSRALALYGDGLLAFRAGSMIESEQRNEAALAVARVVQDQEAEALALIGLSRVAFRKGDYEQVRLLASTARTLTQNLNSPATLASLHMLAAGTRLAGDYDAAVQIYSESLALNRRLGDLRGVAMELHNLGHVELHRGNTETAQRYFAERDKIRNQDDPYEAAMTHLNRAALAFAQGDRSSVKEYLQRMNTTLESAAIALDPDDAFEVEWLHDHMR
jgi:tetratricopeptide (TPR) repeat protein